MYNFTNINPDVTPVVDRRWGVLGVKFMRAQPAMRLEADGSHTPISTIFTPISAIADHILRRGIENVPCPIVQAFDRAVTPITKTNEFKEAPVCVRLAYEQVFQSAAHRAEEELERELAAASPAVTHQEVLVAVSA